ncbi:hypothetical protein I0618_001431 [Staphylococcus pseudintermedius]|nr:hypothetical protein [Staphylococcus pseudintermedius]EGQ3926995.1 hypothetical protein [Staphylococcus pseudintermedius]EKO1111773.1 hypothetical protein [Staphylococcus pseudintermedius]HDU0726238.1 hypothetical protein [Staphylococcus pseudintermedius]
MDSRFPGAEPTTNQRFDYTVTFVEALVDFPVQLIPRSLVHTAILHEQAQGKRAFPFNRLS